MIFKERILYKINSVAITGILFITIFLPLTIGILEDDIDVSAVEKRKLSTKPTIEFTVDSISNFPRLFEEYYSDHFGLRDWFNEMYKLTKYKMGDSPSEDVTIGKDGWLFLGSIKNNYSKYNNPMGDVRNANLYTENELKEFSDYMLVLKSWLNDRGIEYIFVIAPNKHTIYYDKLPSYITKISNYSATDQLVEYLSNNTNISVVDLRQPLIEASKTKQTYYKTDTHWNHNGANVAQYAIMSQIEKMFPKQVTPEKFILRKGIKGGGDLSNFIGVKGFVENHPTPVFENLCNPVKTPPKPKPRETHTITCANQALNVLVFHDSFFQALQPYFSRKFKRSTYIWKKLDFDSLKKYIDKEQPDVVIEEWVERSLPLNRKAPTELKRYLFKQLFECSDHIIYSNNFELLKIAKHISITDSGNDEFKIRIIGNDPIVRFPKLDIKSGNKYILHINMTSSINSTMQVFYSDTNAAGYPFNEKNSIRYPVMIGENDIYIMLDYNSLGKYLRFDPVSGDKGEVGIRYLEIRELSNEIANCGPVNNSL